MVCGSMSPEAHGPRQREAEVSDPDLQPWRFPGFEITQTVMPPRPRHPQEPVLPSSSQYRIRSNSESIGSSSGLSSLGVLTGGTFGAWVFVQSGLAPQREQARPAGYGPSVDGVGLSLDQGHAK